MNLFTSRLKRRTHPQITSIKLLQSKYKQYSAYHVLLELLMKMRLALKQLLPGNLFFFRDFSKLYSFPPPSAVQLAYKETELDQVSRENIQNMIILLRESIKSVEDDD